MKWFSIIFNRKPQFTILFIFLLITTKIYCEETLDTKIKDICLKAESSVKSFFEEKQELPEKFQNLILEDKITENEINSAIKLLLIDQEARSNFIHTRNHGKKFFKIIIYILVIISVIFIVDFEIHFFLRLCFKENIFEPSFTNFYKVSPFYWIFYFILNKQKANTLYNELLNRPTNANYKYLIYTFAFIIFIKIVAIFVVTCFVYNEYDNSSQVTINVLCSSIKFLNELQNGKQLSKEGSRLFGFKNINLYLNELMENKTLFDNYFNNYTETYNKINYNLNEWENYLTHVQKNLSDKNSLKYFFYNYPSDPKYIKQIKCNFSNLKSCKKSLFQSELIYDYYPYNDNSKTLYSFNSNLHESVDILLAKLKIFENFFIESNNSFNFFHENQNYKKGLSKIESIINIYIEQLLEIDKENIFDKFVYSHLSYIYSFDFILLIFLGLNTLLALIYVEYYCVKNFFFGRVVISFVFYNIIFLILGLNFIETNMLRKINNYFLYIKQISKGVYYILNDEIENYENLFNEKNNTHVKNISLIMQFKNNKMNNNLFNYIKYYINNENELKDLLNDKIFFLNTTKLIIINNTLNEIIENRDNFLDYQINDYSEKILNLLNNGLKYTNFVDLTNLGYNGTYLESPFTYLTYVNLITSKIDRDKYGYKEIPCDEIWNISNLDSIQGEYEYKKRDLILCENCNNTCSNDKILLNFMEYTINEIEQRYNHLKNGIYNDSYYELMYYFNALEKLRDNVIFEQLRDLYEINESLKNIQKNIFNSIENIAYIAKKIITIYENIVNKYEKENIFFNYTEFIKDDLYYLLGQMEINFSRKINKEYKRHLNVNIMCFCICFSLIIFYILIAKKMKYYKTNNDDGSHSKSYIYDSSNIEKNEEVPHVAIPNFIKINQLNLRNYQSNNNITNVMNIFVINENVYRKKHRSVTIENGDIFNKNINNIENNGKNDVKPIEAKKILINCKFQKNSSPTKCDENRNDESVFSLAKGSIIEDRKGKILNNIDIESNKRLNYENIKIQNKNKLDNRK